MEKGTEMTRTLEKAAKEKGVEIKVSHRATRLIVDPPTRRVLGLKVKVKGRRAKLQGKESRHPGNRRFWAKSSAGGGVWALFHQLAAHHVPWPSRRRIYHGIGAGCGHTPYWPRRLRIFCGGRRIEVRHHGFCGVCAGVYS